MNDQKNLALGFTLNGIETKEFAIVSEEFKKGVQLGLNTDINFGHNIERRQIGVIAKFKFFQEDTLLVVISVICSFQLTEDTWEELLDEEQQKLILPKGFASHLGIITIGTIRGILHEKTRKTAYEDLILPPINLTKIIEDDVEIDLNEEDTDTGEVD